MIEKFNLEMLNRLDLFFQLFNNITDLVFLAKVNSDKSFSYVLLNKPAKDIYGLTNEILWKTDKGSSSGKFLQNHQEQVPRGNRKEKAYHL